MPSHYGVTFKIGLLGPTRVGKTSLVTALLAQSEILLAGSGVTMTTVDSATEAKIAQNQEALEGDLLAREFRSASLSSTVEPFTFNLKLDPGVPNAEIYMELLDFPGGWLDPRYRPPELAADWEVCKKFIKESTVLLIPVDAALLMESVLAPHKQAVPRLLNTRAVKEVARDWAIERNRQPKEPALVVFCPVKCESYFTDNGGIRDLSLRLYQQFRETYGGVIEAVKLNAPAARLMYAPIDTIGCVEIVRAEWPLDEKGDQDFRAEYRIRLDRRVSRAGVDDVLQALCRLLVEARKVAEIQQGNARDQSVQQSREYAERHEGFLRNMMLWVTRERQARQQAVATRTKEADEVWRRVSALDEVLQKIASAPFGKRVQERL